MRGAALVCAAVLVGAGAERADLRDVSFKIRTDIRYATPENFAGQRLYAEGRCLLREATAEKLLEADKELRGSGLAL